MTTEKKTVKKTVRKKKEKKVDDLVRSQPTQPNQILLLTTPVPMTQNHMYVNKRVGRRMMRVLNSDAQKWMEVVKRYATEQVEAYGWYMEENDTWYDINMKFYFPDKITRDNHNCFKLLFDTLEGVVYKNDYFILPVVTDVQLDREKPRVEIVVTKRNIHT